MWEVWADLLSSLAFNCPTLYLWIVWILSWIPSVSTVEIAWATGTAGLLTYFAATKMTWRRFFTSIAWLPLFFLALPLKIGYDFITDNNIGIRKISSSAAEALRITDK